MASTTPAFVPGGSDGSHYADRPTARPPAATGRTNEGEDVDWHYGNMVEVVAETIPDEAALIHGDDIRSWSEFDATADALAADMVDAGLTEQSKVGIYLYNDPAYVTTMFAAFTAGLVPFNVNYRYSGNEVHYLFDNADAEAVVLERDVDRCDPPWGRRPDHILMVDTGGTTGMPKGVMWTHDDLFASLGRGGPVGFGVPELTNHEELAERVAAGQVLLPACPLMHGTGWFTAFVGLVGGAAICTMPNRSFDPADLLRTIDRHDVTSLIIVGDAFARPILAELRENRDDHDLSSLFLMVSSGVMWSHDVKQGILARSIWGSTRRRATW